MCCPQDDGDGGGVVDQDKVGDDPVLDFKLDLQDEIVNLTWESTQVLPSNSIFSEG